MGKRNSKKAIEKIVKFYKSQPQNPPILERSWDVSDYEIGCGNPDWECFDEDDCLSCPLCEIRVNYIPPDSFSPEWKKAERKYGPILDIEGADSLIWEIISRKFSKEFKALLRNSSQRKNKIAIGEMLSEIREKILCPFRWVDCASNKEVGNFFVLKTQSMSCK